MADKTLLNFKYGIFSRLPETQTPGTVYVTADEKAMYVDLPAVSTTDGGTIAASRIRVSQIVVKDSVREAQPPFSPDAFYYFVQENALLKWIPAKGDTPAAWKQINSVSDVTANLETLTNRVDGHDTAITGLTTRVGNVETAIGGADSGLTKAVNDNKSAIESNDTDIKNLQDSLKETNDKVTANKTAIGDANSGLTKAVNDNTSAITNLTNDKVNVSDYNTKIQKIEGDITGINNKIGDSTAGLVKDIADNAAAIETNAGNIQTNATNIGNNTTAIGGLSTRVGTVETNLGNLTNLVGTLPEGTTQDNVVDFVIAQMEAADAMHYIGGIDAYTDLPTTGVKAGDTHVVIADFDYSGESYYAGDLLVATADQGAEEAYAGGWTHVKTGYQASQEAKLTGANNAIKLTSYTGVDLGTITVTAEAGSALTATVTGNAMTLGIEWGSF